MRLIRIFCVFTLIAVFARPLFAAEHARACSTPVYRQFDFFVGDWDTYDVSDPSKIVARNTVTIILDGCAILEDYRQNDGLHGESFSLYDTVRKVWHQSWVTNRGELLLLDGGLKNGRMIFIGALKTKDGRPSLLRGVWYRQGDGVHETATRSFDGGKTWQPVFDILFVPTADAGQTDSSKKWRGSAACRPLKPHAQLHPVAGMPRLLRRLRPVRHGFCNGGLRIRA